MSDTSLSQFHDAIKAVLLPSDLYIIRKALERYRARIEEVGTMGWYNNRTVVDQELERVDAILAKLDAVEGKEK